MTLIEIATQVCETQEVTDSQTLEKAKRFVKNRFKMIWNRALWRQSRIPAFVECPAGITDIVLPPSFDQVTGARLSSDESQELLPYGDEFAFQTSPFSLFEKPDSPRYFQQLPKVAGVLSVRILPVPAHHCTIEFVGKSKCPDLGESDEPQISGIDEALLAYVNGDMLEWLRQYSKAQVKFQEGRAHLENMLSIECQQSARSMRFIPMPYPTGHNWSQDYFPRSPSKGCNTPVNPDPNTPPSGYTPEQVQTIVETAIAQERQVIFASLEPIRQKSTQLNNSLNEKV